MEEGEEEVVEEASAEGEPAVGVGHEEGGRGAGGGRGAPRRRAGGRGGMKGGRKVVMEPHRHEGVFIAKKKEDALCTKIWFLAKLFIIRRVSVQNEDGTKIEYRVWNPFRSKLAAAIIGGVDNVWIDGTTVSHVSDIVGPQMRGQTMLLLSAHL